MHSPPIRSTAFEPLNIDIYPWARAGAAVTLIAACLNLIVDYVPDVMAIGVTT